MSKTPTFPTLFDEVLQVSVTDLKKWGYLKPNQYKTGVITWSRNGQKTASISIAVNTRSDSPYLELDYTNNGTPVNYRVQLVTVPANIGNGRVWYLLCPHTSKRCRKLYSVGVKFLHRQAFAGCLYESQTYSQKNRKLFKMYAKAFGSDGLYEQLSRKHFRRIYAGKPTKRFSRLMQKISENEKMSYWEKERLLY